MSGDSYWAACASCSAVLTRSWSISVVSVVSVVSACRAPQAQDAGDEAPSPVPTPAPSATSRQKPPASDPPGRKPVMERPLVAGAPLEMRSATGLVSLPTQHFTETQTL